MRKQKEFKDTKIQFERNVAHFGFDKNFFEKKEIDICIFSENPTQLISTIELKYPRNGQVPESMFSFCKDIAFLEQLKKAGFSSAYFLAVADDKNFYQGKTKGIYGLFRNQEPITGTIIKPTGEKNKSVNIIGSYTAFWHSISESSRYCLIEINT